MPQGMRNCSTRVTAGANYFHPERWYGFKQKQNLPQESVTKFYVVHDINKDMVARECLIRPAFSCP